MAIDEDSKLNMYEPGTNVGVLDEDPQGEMALKKQKEREVKIIPIPKEDTKRPVVEIGIKTKKAERDIDIEETVTKEDDVKREVDIEEEVKEREFVYRRHRPFPIMKTAMAFIGFGVVILVGMTVLKQVNQAISFDTTSNVTQTATTETINSVFGTIPAIFFIALIIPIAFIIMNAFRTIR